VVAGFYGNRVIDGVLANSPAEYVRRPALAAAIWWQLPDQVDLHRLLILIDVVGDPEVAEPKTPEEMRYAELRRYIDALARSGSNAKKLQVDLALKIAIPFICLLIALFGAPLAISTPKSGAAWGVAASLATTFIVLLMFQLAKAIGAGGVLPPLLAAWGPNILVAVAAVYLLRKAPT